MTRPDVVGVVAPDSKWAHDWARREGLDRNDWRYYSEPSMIFGFRGTVYALSLSRCRKPAEWQDILSNMEARGSITILYQR